MKEPLNFRANGSFDDYIAIAVTNTSSPIFIPKKHTKKSYAAQNREAKKRRKNKNR